MKESLRMKVMRKLLTYILFVLALCGCDRNSGVKIDRSSVKVEQGRYTGETINLTFYAELTDTVPPIRFVFWDMADGRFHQSGTPVDGVFFVYEVFNPFGERDLKTMSEKAGPSKTATLPLPVFSTPEDPYDYTLKVTFYYGSRKKDVYCTKFRLTHPD